MAQAIIDKLGEEFPCTFCKKICKSTAGLMAHMNRIHPLDSPSGLQATLATNSSPTGI